MNQNCTCEIVNGKKVPMVMSRLVSTLHRLAEELRIDYFQASSELQKQEILGRVRAYNFVIRWVEAFGECSSVDDMIKFVQESESIRITRSNICPTANGKQIKKPVNCKDLNGIEMEADDEE